MNYEYVNETRETTVVTKYLQRFFQQRHPYAQQFNSAGNQRL